MSKLRGQAPADDEVWTRRGELRNPADRSDQPGQRAPERTAAPRPADVRAAGATPSPEAAASGVQAARTPGAAANRIPPLRQENDMADSQELERKLWKHLHDDRTVMLGLDEEAGHSRPMTALAEGDRSPLWFFTARDNELARRLDQPRRATAAFAAKDHALFASIRGRLSLDTDRAVVERLWNPFIAAWYEGGKDDPQLALLRFDAEGAEVWLNENSLLAGVKLLLGADPKKEYAGKVGEVDLER